MISRAAGTWHLLRMLVIGLALTSMAHVGSPDTFFTGNAGPYPVRVTVRLPGVVPGLAQVTVRVPKEAGVIGRVTVQAIQWNLGAEGAPPARSRDAGPWRHRALRRGPVVHGTDVVPSCRRRRRSVGKRRRHRSRDGAGNGRAPDAGKVWVCFWRRSACFSRRGFSPSSALPCARASYHQGRTRRSPAPPRPHRHRHWHRHTGHRRVRGTRLVECGSVCLRGLGPVPAVRLGSGREDQRRWCPHAVVDDRRSPLAANQSGFALQHAASRPRQADAHVHDPRWRSWRLRARASGFAFGEGRSLRRHRSAAAAG